MTIPQHHVDLVQPARRFLFRRAAQWAAAGIGLQLASMPVFASAPATRGLRLDHTHTRERIATVYAQADRYVPEALGALNHFLRDHYRGEVGRIDPRLFDLLHAVQKTLGTGQAFEVISGYRSPATNAALRSAHGRGVASRSLHMDGMAIDVRLPGVPLSDLRDAALSLRAGGVGYYPSEQFVHIDTGRVRRW